MYTWITANQSAPCSFQCTQSGHFFSSRQNCGIIPTDYKPLLKCKKVKDGHKLSLEVVCGVIVPDLISVWCVVWSYLILSLCGVWCDRTWSYLCVVCGVIVPDLISVWCVVWLYLNVPRSTSCPLSLTWMPSPSSDPNANASPNAQSASRFLTISFRLRSTRFKPDVPARYQIYLKLFMECEYLITRLFLLMLGRGVFIANGHDDL